jgi:hypothetical protein
MIHLTGAMRDRGDLMFEDVGRGLLVLRTPKVEVRQSHAQLTIGKLIEAPNGIELYALKKRHRHGLRPAGENAARDRCGRSIRVARAESTSSR